MYENNGQLQNNTHRLLSTPIRNYPHKMQMTRSDIFFLLAAEKTVYKLNSLFSSLNRFCKSPLLIFK